MRLDVAKTLAPFLVVYDASKRPIAGSATLDGELPVPPSGTFTGAIHEIQFPQPAPFMNGENRFTWQPRADVRIAAVVVPIDRCTKGYVLAGRSLREVEVREDLLTKGVLLAWLITMVVTAAAVLLANPRPEPMT